MKLLILTATGGTGLDIVRQAVQRHHQITAFVPSAEKLKPFDDRINDKPGNLLDSIQLEQNGVPSPSHDPSPAPYLQHWFDLGTAPGRNCTSYRGTRGKLDSEWRRPFPPLTTHLTEPRTKSRAATSGQENLSRSDELHSK